MREMTVQEAVQCFVELIAEAERGETIVITKNGTPVAKISPQSSDRSCDPKWQTAYDALEQSLRAKRVTGFRVRTITEDDLNGDDAK